MSHATEMNALRRIAASAFKLATASSKKLSRTPQSRALSGPSQPPTPTFPVPQPLSLDLTALGLRRTVAEKISSAYFRTALRLKSQYELHSRHALQAYPQTEPSGPMGLVTLGSKLCTVLITRYLKTLQSWRSEIIGTVTSRIRELRQAQKCAQQPTKRPFNQAAVPDLEEFFERNSRPTRAEKQALASQTRMDYKQINIWFQNRRSRSKKVSSSSTPTDSSNSDSSSNALLPPDLAASLARILDKYVVDTQDIVVDDEHHSSSNHSASSGPFNSERPQHAFPVCYPPLCSYNPFPISGPLRKFSTPWYRSASSSSRNYQEVDASELLTLLEGMRLRGGAEESPRLSDVPSAGSHYASVGFVTIPPCAPLPALVREPLPPLGHTHMKSRRHSEVPQHPECVAVCCSEERLSRAASSSTRRKVRARARATRNPATDRPDVSSAQTTEGSVAPRRRAWSSMEMQTDVSSGGAASRRQSIPLNAAHTGRPYPTGKPSRHRNTTRASRASSLEFNDPSRTSGSPDPGASSSPTLLEPSTLSPSRVSIPSTSPSPLLSRMSSSSSLRSVSSMSSSSSESDLLLTPPSQPTFLPDLPFLVEASTFDLYTDLNSVFGQDTGLDGMLADGYADYSLSFVDNPGSLSQLATAFTPPLGQKDTPMWNDNALSFGRLPTLQVF